MAKVSNMVVEQLKVSIESLQAQLGKQQVEINELVAIRDEKLTALNSKIENKQAQLMRLQDELAETQQALDILQAGLPDVIIDPAQGI